MSVVVHAASNNWNRYDGPIPEEVMDFRTIGILDPKNINIHRLVGRKVRVCFRVWDHGRWTRYYRSGTLEASEGCDDGCCISYSVKFSVG